MLVSKKSTSERMTVFFDESMLGFRIPDGVFDSLPSDLLDVQMAQPERPERLANTVSVLKRGPAASYLDWRPARAAIPAAGADWVTAASDAAAA